MCAGRSRKPGCATLPISIQLGLTGRHVALAHCVHLDEDEIEILQDDRHQRGPLSFFESETWFRNCSDCETAGAGNFRFAWSGWRGLQQPPRHVYRDAHCGAAAKSLAWSGSVAGEAGVCGWPRSTAQERWAGAEIGSLEVGKRADVIVVRSGSLALDACCSDVVSALVYSAEADDVETVIIDGEVGDERSEAADDR